MKYLCVVLLGLTSALYAKDRQWVDAEVTAVTSANGGAAVAPVGTMLIGVPLNATYYRVETAAMTYVLLFNPLNQWRAPDLVVHGRTKIAVNGKKAFIIQDNGKVAKLPVVEKIANY